MPLGVSRVKWAQNNVSRKLKLKMFELAFVGYQL